MISADPKTDVKKREIKKLASFNFHKEYLQNLKRIVKQAYIFHLILLGGGVFLLNRKNPLLTSL